ncbi:hypothetical protein [Halalkalicoccus salilacus]|uniref:hypothetical protein n=1 Tax=Halalkalicoccus TaxID=332246 RepID=UPI002F9687B7
MSPTKWGVYVASFWLGALLLGPVPGITRSDVSFSAGPDVVARLLVGNAVLSVLFTLVGYVIAFRFVCAYRRRAIDVASILE